MAYSKSLIAVLLVFVFASTNILGFGRTEVRPASKMDGQTPAPKKETIQPPAKKSDDKKPEISEPVAIGGKSISEIGIKKKKFPWLLVGGIMVVGAVAAVLLFKKKKDTHQPTVPTGAIQVESTPAGAKIYLDGNDTGHTTNTTINGIPQGNHAIKLALTGYNDDEQSVMVQAGQTANITATLTASVVREPVMIRLSGGTFMMGSESSEAYAEEKIVHQITLSGFEIGKYEVTQAEWVSVMGSNPSFFKGDRLPVERVEWEDIQPYIRKLNEATGKKYRLPTEAEWEYACRAGTTGDRYGELNSIAWYSENSGGRTHEVGGKAPNGFGLYDTLGNVFEWCADWYADYSAEPVTNPKGPYSGIHHVLRGGSWLFEAVVERASFRNLHVPSHAHDLLGFRLARD
jgi:formylglycine-generating enzyme required for sulfatase activity